MLKRVRAYIEKYQMIAEGDTVIAGVSGGADSVCLLLVLLELQREISFAIRAVHVEHGIRGEESREDAAFVKGLCKDKAIPFIQYDYDVPQIAKERGMSEEETGRMLRYEAFEKEAERCVQGKISVAHNQNDNAETMLHHLIRGSHLRGLTGIPPVRGRIIRPLLCVSRKEIEAYLREKNQDYRTDATNFETIYTRNRIRHEVLPVLEEINPSAVSHMVRTAEALQEAQEYLDMQVGMLTRQTVHFEGREVLIETEKLKSVPNLLRTQVLYESLVKLVAFRKDIAEVHITDLWKLSERQVGKGICLPYGVTAVREYEGIRIRAGGRERPQTNGGDSRTNAAEYRQRDAGTVGMPLAESMQFSCRVFEKDAKIQDFPKKKYTKWLDYDKIKDNLFVRNRKPGDYFFLEEQGHVKKLKQYFVDEKIPREQRGQILLVADGDHIVWVVGYRISAYYKVTEHTRRILEIQYDEAPDCEKDVFAAGRNGGRKEYEREHPCVD